MAHPSKTGEYDDSVLLDNPYLLPWAKHLFKELKTQPKDQPLWDFGYSDHFHVFTQVRRCEQETVIDGDAYQLRHSGLQSTVPATWEACWKFRNVKDGKARRAWPDTRNLHGWLPTSKSYLCKFNATACTPKVFSRMWCWAEPRPLTPPWFGESTFASMWQICLLALVGLLIRCGGLDFQQKNGMCKGVLTLTSPLPRLCTVCWKTFEMAEFWAVMMSPPNASLSPARDRQRAIRSKRFPWGLPQRFLTPEDRRKVTSENACLRTCFSLISILQQHKIPWIFAQPASSKVWFFPEMQELQQHPQCHSMTTDLCQFRTMWRKPITLLFGNLDSQDTARLLRSCTGLRWPLPLALTRPTFNSRGGTTQESGGLKLLNLFPLEFCKTFGLCFNCHFPIETSPPLVNILASEWFGTILSVCGRTPFFSFQSAVEMMFKQGAALWFLLICKVPTRDAKRCFISSIAREAMDYCETRFEKVCPQKTESGWIVLLVICFWKTFKTALCGFGAGCGFGTVLGREELRWSESKLRRTQMRWGELTGVEINWDDMKWDEMGCTDCGDNGVQRTMSKGNCNAMRSDEIRKRSNLEKRWHRNEKQKHLLRRTEGRPAT